MALDARWSGRRGRAGWCEAQPCGPPSPTRRRRARETGRGGSCMRPRRTGSGRASSPPPSRAARLCVATRQGFVPAALAIALGPMAHEARSSTPAPGAPRAGRIGRSATAGFVAARRRASSQRDGGPRGGRAGAGDPPARAREGRGADRTLGPRIAGPRHAPHRAPGRGRHRALGGLDGGPLRQRPRKNAHRPLSRPRSSAAEGPGATSRPSRSPPSNGCMDSTTDGCSSRSETSRPPRSRRATTSRRTPPSRRSTPNEIASGKDGACVDAPCWASVIFGRSAGSSIGRVSGLSMGPSECHGGVMLFGRPGPHRLSRAASARAPGLNAPASSARVRVASFSSIARPGLSAMSCLRPSGSGHATRRSSCFVVVAPIMRAISGAPPRPRASWACAPRGRPASGSRCRPSSRPIRSRPSRPR